MRQHGLIGDATLDMYRPETGRYGAGPAMAAAETLFAADSTVAVAQLTALADARDIRPQALTAASLADLASAMMGGRSGGMRWLLEHPELSGTAAARDRDLLLQALHLGSADADQPALSALSDGPAIAAAWDARRGAAADYASRLTSAATHVTPASVLASLLHLHHVRAHGISPDTETATYRLARAIALSWTARRATSARNGRPR